MPQWHACPRVPLHPFHGFRSTRGYILSTRYRGFNARMTRVSAGCASPVSRVPLHPFHGLRSTRGYILTTRFAGSERCIAREAPKGAERFGLGWFEP